uniref:C-type lectin domain-containing protein n=1 Tax=Takifugu rubripes TaxID=31033 RepID=A0A674MPS0_TAKRU
MARLHQLSAQNANLTATPCLNCPDGWKSFEGQCYYFSNYTLVFEKAREQCQQQGADLVKVSSKEEQKFLATTVAPMLANGNRFWIGLTDSEKEGQWLWMDGSPLEESGNEYCWYDKTCKHPLRKMKLQCVEHPNDP